MRRRIYTDTSVVGGCFDKRFRTASRALFQRFGKGTDILILSDLTLAELEQAPSEVQQIVGGVDVDNIEVLNFTEAAADLARDYISAGVIGPGSLADAQHIATATVSRVDALVSWNFKHIVNLNRIRGYNSINLREGYPLLEIRTPQELIDDE